MFVIEKGQKFAAIALWGPGKWRNLSEAVDLGDGFGAMWGPPVNVGEFWLRTLGTIKAREIEATNLWLIATHASPMPQITNEEDRQLSNKVNDLFYSLLLATPLLFHSGFLLGGVNLGGKPEIRGYGEVAKHYQSEDPLPSVGPEEVRKAKKIMDSEWRSIFYREQNHTRLAYGASAYDRGLREEYLDTRLHQFVRALEGVVRPHGAKQFTNRCQVFIGKSTGTRDFLDECYRLRNKIEHVYDYREALPGLSLVEQGERLLRDTMALTKVCRYVFERLATAPDVRTLFKDAVIEDFWKEDSDKRERLWGPPLDFVL
jgi:hypothetical protein